jgi:hypothetical protein
MELELSELEYITGYRNSGRKPGPIDYRFVTHTAKEYVVGTISHNGSPIQFVFDRDDLEKVEKRAWHLSSGKYIGSTFYLDGGVKLELYLHNLVMNRMAFNGKGPKQSVDHINRNGLDNRKENLRIVSQSQQNINQPKKKRAVILPENCGIQPDEIPKHIWYVRAQGQHGDRFAIEFKTEGVCWKTTSSKAVSIKDKLEQAKVKLAELYESYPYLNPAYEVQKQKKLEDSFQQILATQSFVLQEEIHSFLS